MKVNVAQLRREVGGIAAFEFREDFSSFDLGLEGLTFQSPVHAKLQVNNTGKSLFAHGVIEADLKASCGRCLENMSYQLKFDYEDEWVFEPQATEEQLETSFIFDKDEFEIDELVLEQIVVNLPMKFICSPECRGLCPVCGTNKNLNQCNCDTHVVDPRLAALAKFKGLS